LRNGDFWDATLMMGTLHSSETYHLVRATRRNISEDAILHSHRRENLKSYVTIPFYHYHTAASDLSGGVVHCCLVTASHIGDSSACGIATSQAGDHLSLTAVLPTATIKQTNFVAFIHKKTIPTELPPPVGEF
jgi:hypothetical protein